MQTEVDSRVAGTQDNATSKHYKTVATITLGANRTITEQGVFSASSAGTLWDRSVFTGLPLNFGEAIQFSYDLTLNDGG